MQRALGSEGLGLGPRSPPGSAVAGRGPGETAWRAGVPSPQKRSQHLGFQGLRRESTREESQRPRCRRRLETPREPSEGHKAAGTRDLSRPRTRHPPKDAFPHPPPAPTPNTRETTERAEYRRPGGKKGNGLAGKPNSSAGGQEPPCEPSATSPGTKAARSPLPPPSLGPASRYIPPEPRPYPSCPPFSLPLG